MLPSGKGEETVGRAAQERANRALAELAAHHPRETIVAESHGNLIALILNARDDAVGFEFWDAMPTPALYELELRIGDSD